MHISQFDYTLPEELIAQSPASPRDHSRLLDATKSEVAHRRFYDIVNLFGEDDTLVLNDTKVIPARLKGYTLMGNGERKDIECFLVRNVDETHWEVMCFPGQRLKPGRKMHFETERFTSHVGFGVNVGVNNKPRKLQAVVKEMTYMGRIVEFNCGKEQLVQLAESFGEIPLPQYIKDPLADWNDYQTVYANDGAKNSVAAPTAGLHFTPELLDTLKNKGVQIEYVTLGVGPGTFKPIDTENIEDYQIHEEPIWINEDVAHRITRGKQQGKKVTAVGTTTVRTLESFADPKAQGVLTSGHKNTSLYITPGYEFQMVDRIITNFHLPQSSLLIMMSAAIGHEKLMHLYEQAIEEKYRFYSLGDAMVVEVA